MNWIIFYIVGCLINMAIFISVSYKHRSDGITEEDITSLMAVTFLSWVFIILIIPITIVHVSFKRLNRVIEKQKEV